MQQYHIVFDKYMKQYLIGELIWNFADFRTGNSSIYPHLILLYLPLT